MEHPDRTNQTMKTEVNSFKGTPDDPTPINISSLSSISSSPSSGLPSIDLLYQNKSQSKSTLKRSLNHEEHHSSSLSSLSSTPSLTDTEDQPNPTKPKSNAHPRPKPITKKKKQSGNEIQSIKLISEEDSLDSDGNILPDLKYEIQNKNCISLPPELAKYRCSSCIGKRGGSICSFVHIRSWIYSKKTNKLVGGPLFEYENQTEDQTSYRRATLPTVFNQSPTPNQAIELRQVVAKSLKPILERELREFQNDEKRVRFIGRRIELLTRCDHCLVTLIGVAWMCQRCGKEACVNCFRILKSLSDDDQIIHQNRKHEQEDHTDQIEKLDFDCNSKWIRALQNCVKWFGNEHKQSSHIKISHLTKHEILNYLNEIDRTLQLECITTTPPSTPFPLDSVLYKPSDSQSEPYFKMHVNALEYDHQIFDQIRSTGIPLVVTGMENRMKKSWDPVYLGTTYGEEQCTILDSNLPHGDPVKTNVRDFFDKFQNINSQNQTVWKLRDWPPETDFKTKFPDLYEDFQKALPIAEFTSRNGFKNIAAHFPENANIPDIGPKMYIAMQNSDQSGSAGSTGLHMDVSDGINVQTYAKSNQEGLEGCALWYLYHASDTAKLREFLYNHHSKKLGISLEEVKSKQDDPIHTTRTYIDEEMRKQLWVEYGVKGYEIKQKSGEAIFIPAYTAHQVCNLANCIKVATDFVSPTSIEMCLKLKAEFRRQIHEHQKPWKEDLLQIDQMLLYAFDSLGRNIEDSKT